MKFKPNIIWQRSAFAFFTIAALLYAGTKPKRSMFRGFEESGSDDERNAEVSVEAIEDAAFENKIVYASLLPGDNDFFISLATPWIGTLDFYSTTNLTEGFNYSGSVKQTNVWTTINFTNLNAKTFFVKTSLHSRDSDSDGITDKDEIGYIETNESFIWHDTSDAMSLINSSNRNIDSMILNIPLAFPFTADSDGDGLSDVLEFFVRSNPYDRDTDNDGLPDAWEYYRGLSPVSFFGDDGADGDLDNDGVSNATEYRNASNPNDSDTDNDGLPDLLEIGSITTGNEPQWIESYDALNITYDIENDGYKTVSLPYSIMINDKVINAISLDKYGAVHLRSNEMTGFIGSNGGNVDIATFFEDTRVCSLFPFSNNMQTTSNSCVTVGNARKENIVYCVVKYENFLATTNGASAGFPVSFQLAIPYGRTNKAYVKFGGVHSAASGRDTTVGFVGFKGRQRHAYCYNQRGKIYSGLGLVFNFGLETNPNSSDTDGDGISDYSELQSGTNPRQADTDGDGLNDSWELTHLMNPLVNNETDNDPTNDKDADPDGDGRTNAEECDDGTDPQNADSDGDGKGDGEEAAGSSDSADSTDGGIPGSRAIVNFTFGDPSGSHSEKYRLEIKPTRPINGTMPREFSWVNAEYGVCESKTARLVRGCTYSVTMKHSGTNETESPDYDYQLLVTPGSSVGVEIIDEQNLLTSFDDTSNYFSGEGKVAYIKVYDASIIADYNRDGRITDTDKSFLYSGKPLRHWINSDRDEMGKNIATDNSDALIHPVGTSNAENLYVDGRCDLIDFIPIRLDLWTLLRQLDDYTKYEFRLSQEDAAVNVVWTSLTGASLRDYLRVNVSGCGLSGKSYAYNAHVQQITSKGVLIPQWMIDLIAGNNNAGMFLIEGKRETTKPIVVSCVRKAVRNESDEKEIFRMSLPLKISPIEDMYRWFTLRGAANGSVRCYSRYWEPSNMPDAELSEKDVFFLHGFKVGEDDARAWGAEMFKRLWQSGSNARFWMVCWRGDQGVADGFNYHENVYNAFCTAQTLASNLNNYGGENKIVMAHSLGNMVVASAIQDFGLRVDKFFMLNSAVPSEAFNEDLSDERFDNPLVHDEWRDYLPRTWASLWHSHFPTNDNRSKLTWKGRFASVASKTYNFYSSGDEVLELYQRTPDFYSGVTLSEFGRYAWHKQESYKGRAANVSFAFAATDWSGWGFRENDFGLKMYTASQVNAIPPEALATNTVFNLNPQSMNSPYVSQGTINQHLAKGIPSLSPAAGTVLFRRVNERDINMNVRHPNGFWRTGKAYLKERWLHSDIKNASFYFTYPIFDAIIDKGELK